MITLTVQTEYTTCSGVSAQASRLLRDTLRYRSAEATEFNPRYTSGYWDGFVELYDAFKCQFPTGLLVRVKRLLEREGLEYDIRYALPEIPEDAQRTFAGDPLRDYQEEAVRRALMHRRGIVRVPTGGGKTHIAEHLIHASRTPRAVLLLPNRVLLNQTHRRLQKAFPDSTVLRWGDGSKDIHSPALDSYILVSTVQSAWKQTSNVLLRRASMVLVDECHHQAASTFQQATRLCNQARFLIGFSATPFRDDGADLEMEGWLGPLLYNIGYQELIDQGYLVPPEFHKVYSLDEAYSKIEGLRTLIFSEKIQDLENARHIFERNKTPILTSRNKSREIREHLSALEQGDIKALAATPLFDEGLDLPNLDAVVFFATGRSRVRALQRVGRAMRPAPGKSKCIVIDIVDKAYRDRLEAYKSEPAFAARVGRR